MISEASGPSEKLYHQATWGSSVEIIPKVVLWPPQACAHAFMYTHKNVRDTRLGIIVHAGNSALRRQRQADFRAH